jgi:hypothetical protein
MTLKHSFFGHRLFDLDILAPKSLYLGLLDSPRFEIQCYQNTFINNCNWFVDIGLPFETSAKIQVFISIYFRIVGSLGSSVASVTVIFTGAVYR